LVNLLNDDESVKNANRVAVRSKRAGFHLTPLSLEDRPSPHRPAIEFIAELEDLAVEADRPARVVIITGGERDSRTGRPKRHPHRCGTRSNKVHDAAQQFEALLLGCRCCARCGRSNPGWLGSGGERHGDCATDFAEQQFATVMAQQGGLGTGNVDHHGVGGW